MKPVNTNHYKVTSSVSVTLAKLFLITSTLFGTSLAQSSFSAGSFFISIAIFVGIACFMCVLFWGFVGGIVCFIKSRQASLTRIPCNARERRTQQLFYPQATPSAGGSQPYPVQSNYPQPVPSQQVSLPEATLHQGDAPPGYEEAVRMKTVDIDGEQHIQS